MPTSYQDVPGQSQNSYWSTSDDYSGFAKQSTLQHRLFDPTMSSLNMMPSSTHLLCPHAIHICLFSLYTCIHTKATGVSVSTTFPLQHIPGTHNSKIKNCLSSPLNFSLSTSHKGFGMKQRIRSTQPHMVIAAVKTALRWCTLSPTIFYFLL